LQVKRVSKSPGGKFLRPGEKAKKFAQISKKGKRGGGRTQMLGKKKTVYPGGKTLLRSGHPAARGNKKTRLEVSNSKRRAKKKQLSRGKRPQPFWGEERNVKWGRPELHQFIWARVNIVQTSSKEKSRGKGTLGVEKTLLRTEG